jgi:hypothetical protein
VTPGLLGVSGFVDRILETLEVLQDEELLTALRESEQDVEEVASSHSTR